jgi:hypothetical protein
MAALEIGTLWSIAKDIFDFLRLRSRENRDDVVKAHSSMNKAFIATYHYLKNQDGHYLPNPELANLWNEASSAVLLVNPSLGNMLHYKSQFWLDPELYERLGRANEVIELNKIVDEMERLRDKL